MDISTNTFKFNPEYKKVTISWLKNNAVSGKEFNITQCFLW